MHPTRAVLVALALSASATALAVPFEMTHQGRLLDGTTGEPVDGPVSLTFGVYDAPADGALLWTETVDLDVEDGFYAVTLGRDGANPLDSAVFAAPTWLELTVDAGTPLPRQAVTSVPYAYIAHTAENVDGGVVDATEIRVNGATVIDGDGTFTGADTLSSLSCADGEVARFDAGAWTCATPLAADDVRDLLSDAPVALADGTTVNGEPVATGPHFTADDAVAAVEGAPLTLADGTTVNGEPVATGPHFTAEDAVAAVGPHFTAEDAVAAVGPHYTDAQARTAVAVTPIALADGSTVGGRPIAAGDHYDDDDARAFVEGTALTLADGTTLNGADLAVGPHYTDAQARAAVGPHLTVDEAVAAVGPHFTASDARDAVGPHYTDAQARAAVGPHFTASDARDAVGPHYNDAQARAAVGPHLTVDEAVTAVGPHFTASDARDAVGPHYTDAQARAAVGPHFTAEDAVDAVSSAPIALDAGTTVGGEPIATGAHYTDARARAAVGPHFTASDARAAVGPHFTANDAVEAVGPHYTDEDAVAAVGPHYTDARARAAVGPHLTVDEAVAAVGPHFTDEDAKAAVGPHYTDAQARTAVAVSPIALAAGSTAGGQPIATGEHYADDDAVAAVAAADAYVKNDGDALTGGLQVDTLRVDGEVSAQCMMRVLRYEMTCTALAMKHNYDMVAAVSPKSSNATGTNGTAVCGSYVGNNDRGSWSCLSVPYVYDYRSDWGDDIRPTWHTCGINHGGGHSKYEWFDKDDCTGVLMACCARNE